MVKKICFKAMLIVGLAILLSACGGKSQEAVVKKLENQLGDMSGYKAKAEMKMNTGQAGQTYQIDIWHQKKDNYRVGLTSNEDEKSSQVILKNKDGVFVLTPTLNKSFKFQTEWPDNSSQPYLFQSLVNDIKKDEDAAYEATDDHYVFRTKTNYQNNNNLPFQEIYFDKKNYTPVLVKVLDKDKKPLVEVHFSEFKWNPSFAKDDFVVEENMQSSGQLADVPTSGNVEEQALEVFVPSYTSGSELVDKKHVDLDNGERVILTYSGEKNFTLIQEAVHDVSVLSMPEEISGDIVNLGFTIGALSTNAIEWSHNGMDFYLASDELTKEELVEVAQSVTEREVK
ncbi:outer membrane lipoprotein carrier protein LolA [Ornithinibacillus gellani]|uniref:LolA family protein n=1 Tax=Ornithinibacillus gellani TaxID=2293253 RepID=UPI000F4ABF43|nr:outer membrane lipoprotein carrier protein LolA [Ornithinibacillus gellani]TQS76418.1 outer membrane lipoprotein carrier protein LolA [Ornithinibacillus gellani]